MDIWVEGHLEVRRVIAARQTLIRLGLQEKASHLISYEGRGDIWEEEHLEVRRVSSVRQT